jgi:hypothetical protein
MVFCHEFHGNNLHRRKLRSLYRNKCLPLCNCHRVELNLTDEISKYMMGMKNDLRAWSASKYEKVEGADKCIPAEASSSSSSSLFDAEANEE